MASPKLPNYLKSNRKRLALSQDEVAFLLGIRAGAKVCRDERFAREPSLATALAYEAVFQKPVRELFEGLYQTVEEEVADRAKVLSYRLGCQNADRECDQKLKSVAGIVSAKSNREFNHL